MLLIITGAPAAIGGVAAAGVLAASGAWPEGIGSAVAGLFTYALAKAIDDIAVHLRNIARNTQRD